MSHFLTLVFTKNNGETVEELLAPFDEDIRVAPYVEYTKEQAVAAIRKFVPKAQDWTDDKCYVEMKKYFSDDMIQSNGDLLSTYNPNSKWNWYCVGGRWDKFLKTIKGEQVNTAYVNEVDWTGIIPFAAITPDGKWFERGITASENEDPNENLTGAREEKFRTLVASLDKDTIVTVVDCHM